MIGKLRWLGGFQAGQLQGYLLLKYLGGFYEKIMIENVKLFFYMPIWKNEKF